MAAKKIRLIAVIVVVAVLVIICLSGIYVVNPGEQAVVLTFGKISDTKDSGIYWHLPMVQDVQVQSTSRLYNLEYGFRTVTPATTTTQAKYEDRPEEAIMLTSDQNIVNVECVYQVKIADVSSFLYSVDDPFGTMQCAFETVLRRNLQNRTLDEALLAKQEIEAQVLPDFQAMLKPYKLGVTVASVMIQNISVPDEASAAYADVINATTEKTKNLDEAEKYKNQVVPNARAQAYKMLQDAQAYSAKTVANAEGEVAQFNDVYDKYINNKEITRKRLLIETLESILTKANQLYMMDDSSGALKLLNLNGVQGSGALPAQPAVSDTSITPTPAPTATEGGN